MGIFKRLIRPNARPIDGPWPDEYSPPARLGDPLWEIANMHAANSSHGGGRTLYRAGHINGPQNLQPTPDLPLDAPPTLIVTDYAKARHGVGLFDVEPIIPEGEVL